MKNWWIVEDQRCNTTGTIIDLGKKIFSGIILYLEEELKNILP